MSTTGLTIAVDAFAERNVFGAGDPIPPEDADLANRLMNQLIDQWNAMGHSAYGERFVSYTLTPSLQPHTIGPTGTFTVASRPDRIDGANLIIGSGTSAVRYPIEVRDAQWWAGVSMPGTTSTIPTDLFYDPTFANGSLYLFPVPTAAYTLELMTRRLLTQLALTDTFSLPAGYQRALTLTVADELPVSYGQRPPDLAGRASRARAIAFAANRVTPRLMTHDAGMPGCSR